MKKPSLPKAADSEMNRDNEKTAGLFWKMEQGRVFVKLIFSIANLGSHVKRRGTKNAGKEPIHRKMKNLEQIFSKNRAECVDKKGVFAYNNKAPLVAQ